MTDPIDRSTGLHVPARRLDTTPRLGRVWLVLATGAAVITLAVIGGRLPPDDTTALSASPSPTRAGSSSPSNLPSGRLAPTASPSPLASLPILPNQALPFPATATFVRRTGDDAELVGWRSGQSTFETLAIVPGAFADIEADDSVVVDLSPDGRYLAVVATRLRANGEVEGGEVRLLSTATGAVLTTLPGVPTGVPGLAWAPGSQMIVVARGDRPWQILAIDGDDRVSVTRYRPPAGTGAPPIGSSLEPVGFAADGRSLYLGRPDAGTLVAAVRVDTTTGRGRAIERYPTDGGARLVPSDVASYPIDPITGRVLVPFSESSPGAIPVYEPDGRRAYEIPADSLSGAAWTGDGRIVLLELDATAEPPSLQLLTVNEQGRRDEVVLELPNTALAALLTARDGFAAIALADGNEDTGALLVVVRLRDAAISRVRVTPAMLTGTVAFDWFEPPA